MAQLRETLDRLNGKLEALDDMAREEEVRSEFTIISFLASGDFLRLLITFANNMDPDQDQF